MRETPYSSLAFGLLRQGPARTANARPAMNGGTTDNRYRQLSESKPFPLPAADFDLLRAAGSDLQHLTAA